MQQNRRSYLVAGLGNPGPGYRQTRHNIGFLAVDALAVKMNCSFSYQAQFQGELCSFIMNDARVVLLKPQTYMNRSGLSVSRVLSSEGLPLHRLIVIHDDLDLPFGRLKIVFDRGDGGHNGVRSVIDEVAGRDFIRVRCGIARPDDDTSVIDYVLAPFSQAESSALANVLEAIGEAVTLVVQQGKTAAMNQINASV